MRPRPPVGRIAAIATMVVTFAACDASAPTGVTRPMDARASLITATTTPTLVSLYQQTATEGYVRLCFNGYTCADDFVVPVGETWTITDVALTGTGGGTAAVPTQVQFYRDAGGLPGALIQSFSVPPISSTPEPFPFFFNYFRALPAPLVLTAGTYWIGARDFGWAVVIPTGNTAATFNLGGGPWFRLPGEDFAFRLFTRQTPTTALEALQRSVAGLGLSRGITTSLDAKLEAALQALAADDSATACDALQALLNHVRAQRAKQIPAGDADAISATVTSIRDQIGC